MEEAFRHGLDAGADRLTHLSDRLAHALSRPDFPKHQIARWLWLASQYRIHADVDPTVATPAAAALFFLEEVLTHGMVADEDSQDLNWILDTTVARLVSTVGPAHLKGCLSTLELQRIDERLSAYDDEDPFDVNTFVAAIRPQLDLFARLGGLGDLAGLSAKTETLIAAAARPGAANAPARAALRYLAERHDAVNDDVGLLGLLDDIYVLEWAYAAVEGQTLCLPILDAMSKRWPFVATLGLGAKGAPLDRFGRYVACAALSTLANPQAGALVLREAGPYPVVVSVAAAVEAVASQSDLFDAEMLQWTEGCPVTVADGTAAFHARYGGRIAGTARPRWRLHVADAGTITVGEEVLPYIARSPREWKRLSNGSHILTWLKDRNVDGLAALTSAGRRRPQRHDAVLLVTPRAKLDRFLPALRPQGLSPGALLGARWIDAQGRSHDLPNSASDRPLLYACADPGTACDLVAEPPDHVSGWRIVIDGAGAGRALHAALSASGRLDRARLCIVAHLHEREALSGLVEQGLGNVWYLEDQDVEVPLSAHPGKCDETDPVARFLLRRSAHWTAAYAVHLNYDPFLEAVSDCLRRGNARAEGDPSLDALDLTVATFLRRAIAHPLPDDDDRRALEAVARSIAAQASTLAVYEAHAAEIRDLFAAYPEHSGGNRRSALLELSSSVDPGEAVAVVCRSATTADRCRRAADTSPLAAFEWTTVEALRASAPYDRVVVPGWLGRHNMREISNVGFGARTDFLFLPFEQRWYDKTMTAARRWERRLERSTVKILEGLVGSELRATEPRWHEHASRRIQVQSVAETEALDDRPETSQAEVRAVAHIQKALPSGGGRCESAKAQVVLFTEPGTFALLPPAGHVIVLPEDGGVQPAGAGERRLLLPVSALVPGMLTALPLETDRDLVDAWADRILNDGGEVRRRADAWKRSLKHHFANSAESAWDFARRLAEAGEPRDGMTVRSWANDTRSVAPRNYRRVIPLIADLVGDVELRRNVADTVAAVETVYRARSEAADAIVAEIFSGTIDLTASTIAFDVEGRRLVYALLRVERTVGVQEVPAELIGRRLRLADLPARERVA